MSIDVDSSQFTVIQVGFLLHPCFCSRVGILMSFWYSCQIVEVICGSPWGKFYTPGDCELCKRRDMADLRWKLWILPQWLFHMVSTIWPAWRTTSCFDTKVLIAEKRVVNAHRGGTVCAGLACALAKVCVSRACIPAKVCFAFFMTAWPRSFWVP